MKKMTLLFFMLSLSILTFGQTLNNKDEKMVSSIHYVGMESYGPYSGTYDIDLKYRGNEISSVCYHNGDNKVILERKKDGTIERREFEFGKERPYWYYTFTINPNGSVKNWNIYDTSDDGKITGLLQLTYHYNDSGLLSKIENHTFTQLNKGAKFEKADNGAVQETEIQWYEGNAFMNMNTIYPTRVKEVPNVKEVQFSAFKNDMNVELSAIMYGYNTTYHCFGPECLLELVGWVPIKCQNLPAGFKTNRRINVTYNHDKNGTITSIDLYRITSGNDPYILVATIEIEYVH